MFASKSPWLKQLASWKTRQKIETLGLFLTQFLCPLLLLYRHRAIPPLQTLGKL